MSKHIALLALMIFVIPRLAQRDIYEITSIGNHFKLATRHAVHFGLMS